MVVYGRHGDSHSGSQGGRVIMVVGGRQGGGWQVVDRWVGGRQGGNIITLGPDP